MEKLDFKKLVKGFYNPPKDSPEIVEVPELQYLMIDGTGDPNALLFQQAVEALYSVAYTLKFSRKKQGLEPDYSMGPLQGLWWMGDNTSFDGNQRVAWQWTCMLWLPDFISNEEVEQTVEIVKIKKPNPLLTALRIEKLKEGKVAQIMYFGAYADEAPTIMNLHAYITGGGYSLRGKHHEIYLGDPRRLAPEKLKTIIRQPIA